MSPFIEEENQYVLFVTDKYSSLNKVKRTNEFVSIHKQWKNKRYSILLTVPDKDLSSLHLGAGGAIPVP